MALAAGQLIPLTIEKPAAGGRMIARADGQIVLVLGAIPGERVTARVERVAKGVVYAHAVSVEEASPDRRDPFGDPQCGGCLFAHIDYARQLEIKSQIVGDAFGRIGHLTLPVPLQVAASPTEGYRMRARLHVRGGRIGFFREGTHDLCDARGTRQLLPATCDVLDRLASAMHTPGCEAIRELELSENIDASERVIHLDAVTPVDPSSLKELSGVEGLNGLSLNEGIVAGNPHVSDRLSIEGHDISWRRHVLVFFQGNRYLLGDLVSGVISQIDQGSRVVDLYAGAGLFSVPAALVRGAQVTAVEGDRASAADLAWNATQTDGAVEMSHQSVEEFTNRTTLQPDVVVVDPPRTGLSKEALAGAIRLGARRIIYVSCDVATLARDARRLVDVGYGIANAAAFDMFPNTPHVEMTVRFEREPARHARVAPDDRVKR